MVTSSSNDDDGTDDGFLTTLHALQKVIQPANELHKQVHTLQKENRTLFEKLEALRQESQEELQAVQEEARIKHQQQETTWQQNVQALKKQADEAFTQFQADLVKKTEKIKEMELEQRAIVEKDEEEQKALEESMIQLEDENQSLKERCIKAETMSSRLQTELNQRTHAFEQSKVAMQMTRKLLSDTESNTAEINKYKEQSRETQSAATELEIKLHERERQVNALQAKVSTLERDAATAKAEYESKLAVSAVAAEEVTAEKIATLNQQVQEQKIAYTALEEEHKTRVAEWQKKALQKDALLEAREKMYKLVKAKNESFQKKETAMKQQVEQAQTALNDANTKHAADIASLKEEIEETKDELKCAEEEVKRYRESQSSSSQVEAKLKETERELAAAMAMVASMQKQAKMKAESKVSEDHSMDEDKDTTKNQLSSLQLELEGKNKAIASLEEQLQSQSSEFKSLLEAKDVMLKLVAERSESMETEQVRLKQEIQDSKAALVSSQEELDKLKQELKRARDSLSSASQLQSKLEETEKNLAAARANATFVVDNAYTEAFARAEQRKTEGWSTKGAAHVRLQQQLDEKEKVCLALQAQLQSETQELKNKLSKKDELLKAKERMLKLVTAKSESLQKNEAASKRAAMDAQTALEEEATKHATEMASYKEEMDDIKDELKRAEKEVARCRSELEELESQVRTNETLEPPGSDKKPSFQAEVTSIASAQVEPTGTAPADDSSSRKRPALDDGGISSASERLDAMKANLLAAKSHRSKRKKG